MNAFLWLGAASTAVLLVSLVVDATDGVFDVLDGLEFGGDWLSLPVIAAFLGAFGFGAGAVYPTIGMAAVIPGALVGLAFAFFTTRLVRAIDSGPSDRPESEASLLGATGRIVTVPTAASIGEVLLQRANGPTKVACRADQVIALGTEVVVVQVSSSTLVTVIPLPQELIL